MSKPDLGRLIAQTMAPPAEGRDIETVTAEILDAKRRGGQAILDVGRGLIEAKGMLSHGEWLPWLEERVEFSERTAQRFIRLAQEWTNPTALSDLGATKALAMLALPAEEREEFAAEHDVIDMSARQLEDAIRERNEARKAAEEAAAAASVAEQARAKMAEDMRLLNARLEGSREDREQAVQDVARLEQELAELKARPVEVAVETVVDQAAIDKARQEAVDEMQAKLDKAKEAADKARDKQKQAEASVEILKRSLENMAKEEKRAALGTDKDLAQFELLFAQAQETANKMHGILLKVQGRDADAAGRLRKALRALADAVGRWAE